jgi:hypothetical protein
MLLPAAFAAGLAARKPVPAAISIPALTAGGSGEFERVVWTQSDLWPGQRLVTQLRRNMAGAMALELAAESLAKPDLLLYWASGAETNTTGLPDNARLLGAAIQRAWLPFPPAARGEPGRLLLYSLADHEIVAASKPLVVQPD